MQENHPSPAALRAFAQGRLAGAEFRDIEAHLERCDSCCEVLSQQPDSTLIELARHVATEGFRATPDSRAQAEATLPKELQDHPRYRLLGLIGTGGMGAVYQAEHRLMQRIVALKIVHPSLVARPEAVQRFRREVRVAARLSHPNIVAAYDADQAGELHFLIMEYVDGASLEQQIADSGPASVAQACDWMRQAALGLQHAHEQGMAHRDIKPHNLMLARDGTVKILDFGLTRLVTEQSGAGDTRGASASPTRDGMILGTPDYIAPEQIENSSAADIRADIYSLGCTLYFALSGRPPFSGRTVLEKLRAHGALQLPPLDPARDDVPHALLEVLARMTAKDPADRYATPREVADALAEFSGAKKSETPVPPPVSAVAALSPVAAPPPLAVAVRPQTPSTPLPGLADRARRVARSPAGIAAGIVIALLLVAAGWWQFFSGGNVPLPTDAPRRFLLLLPSRGLWFADYKQFVAAVRAAPDRLGVKTQLVVAGISRDPSGLASGSEPGEAMADVPIGPQLRAEDFEALIFLGYDTSEFSPGGEAGDETRRLVAEFRSQGKIVASLCAGQRALASHGLLQGKHVAACQYVEPSEIAAGGGTTTPRNVVEDGRIVTAASDADAPEFVQTIVESLNR